MNETHKFYSLKHLKKVGEIIIRTVKSARNISKLTNFNFLYFNSSASCLRIFLGSLGSDDEGTEGEKEEKIHKIYFHDFIILQIFISSFSVGASSRVERSRVKDEMRNKINRSNDI